MVIMQFGRCDILHLLAGLPVIADDGWRWEISKVPRPGKFLLTEKGKIYLKYFYPFYSADGCKVNLGLLYGWRIGALSRQRTPQRSLKRLLWDVASGRSKDRSPYPPSAPPQCAWPWQIPSYCWVSAPHSWERIPQWIWELNRLELEA